MRFKFATGALAAALSISLLGATGAAAATEFGDSCVADRSIGGEDPPVTLLALSSPNSPLPTAAPSAGVITKWRLSLTTPPPPVGAFPPIIPQTLQVVRVDANAKTAHVVGESSGFVGSGPNTVAARIPVLPGDRLGLYGEGPVTHQGQTQEVGTLFCDETAGADDIVGVVPGRAAVGSTVPYGETNEFRVPAVAVIEPDADNDGFGDETQDQCPQSAAIQGACPQVVPAPVLSTAKQVRKGSVTIIVSTDVAAPVSVLGVVKLGKGKKAKLNGGTRSLVPGTLGKFTLKFTKKVKKKLGELPPKRSLRLNVTVSGTSSSGAVATKKLKVKIKGQAKPSPKKARR